MGGRGRGGHDFQWLSSCVKSCHCHLIAAEVLAWAPFRFGALKLSPNGCDAITAFEIQPQARLVIRRGTTDQLEG